MIENLKLDIPVLLIEVADAVDAWVDWLIINLRERYRLKDSRS